MQGGKLKQKGFLQDESAQGKSCDGIPQPNGTEKQDQARLFPEACNTMTEANIRDCNKGKFI